MKRILALLPFLCMALGIAAQDNPWQWTHDNNGAQDRTVVIADLVVNGSVVPLDDIGSRYLVGAFIDGECRGMAEVAKVRNYSWLQIEVYGNYGQSNDYGKPIVFHLYDMASQTDHEMTSSVQVTWNQETYGMPSTDHVVLSAWLDQDGAVITFPATLTLSKLHDTQLTLTHANPQETVVNLSGVNIYILGAPEGWKAATIAGSGLKWTLRGLAVGEYNYYVTYEGRRMLSDQGKTTGKIIIPAEVGFENGWDWISSYAPTPLPLVNAGTGDYLSTLTIDNNNKIIEIRSQKNAIYNDPETGIFGDITELSATAGAYKIKSTYEDKNADRKVFNFGTVNGAATADMLPQIEPGYNWICYPHENSHSLETMQRLLSFNATAGDAIIARDAFLEFDGVQWVGSIKTFEAGKGYIYYSENDRPVKLNWGDYYMPQENVAEPDKVQAWSYDAHLYASNMPVVAMLDDNADTERYSIGAFVGDECRGHGEVADGKHFFISVAGNNGEEVSFKLYDKTTGAYTDLDRTLRYGASAGSLRAPVTLGTSQNSVRAAAAQTLSMAFNGETVMVNGTSAPLTVAVRDLSGHTLITSHSTVTTLESLPGGVYVVTASSGQACRTIKITK